jgi:UDP-N-acetylglucosamine 2-epimerase (non-hydrolysing)
VIGDVNASLACALVAQRHNLPVIHVEAGLRSYDIRMPEELNRITIDHISKILFTHCREASRNLEHEGIGENVYLVGNTAIDALELIRPRLTISAENHNCILITLHRPENIDNTYRLETIMKQVAFLSRRHKVIFPIHPRTRKAIDKLGMKLDEGIFTKPLGYIEMMSFMSQAYAVITDSGGIQEETSYLGVNCLTVRENTERPITLEYTNRLIEPEQIADTVALLSPCEKMEIPLWDGKTAERIVDMLDYLERVR